MVDAAIVAIDRDGPAGLSLRRLAADLGITANALYVYFRTKRHLEDAVADRLLRAAAAPRPESDAPRERLLGTALALRAELLAHPAALPLVLRWSGGEGTDRLGSSALQNLRAMGFDVDAATRTAYALTACALGTIALDLAEMPPGRPRGSDEEVAATRVAALPKSTASVAQEDLEVIAQLNSADQYRWNLERILDGAGATPDRMSR